MSAENAFRGRVAACIGVGNVGRAWAVVFARAGCRVRLWDADPAAAPRALPMIAATVADLRAAGLPPGGEAAEATEAILARITPAETLEDAVAGAAWVQESALEDLAVKRALTARLDAAAPPGATIASSTSAIPASAYAGDLPGAARCLVAHPVNPPSLIRLVEVCGHPGTDPAVIADALAFMTALGMSPVHLRREIEGFLLNRLQYTLVAEALHLVGEGYCSPEDVEAVVRDGLAPRWAFMGPFETAHLNAHDGYAGFADRLGGMMRAVGRTARPDYAWDEALTARIHAAVAARVPVDGIPAAQRRRDRRVARLRRLLDEEG